MELPSDALDRLLADAVDAGHVPCAVVTVADDGGVRYEGAAGPRAAGSDDSVTPDSLFAIMSMTKAVTTVAALQLVEQGRLDLDAPAETYRPELADVQVLDGFDGDVPRLRAPARPVTVRHLLTHTAGFGYWFWNEQIARWEAVTGTPNMGSGSLAALSAPLVADPGTRWEYGIGTEWLGRVIEAVAGATLDVHLREHVTGPLGMDDTTFGPSAEQAARIVPVHMRGEDGTWQVVPPPSSDPPELCNGGAGLLSTPRDFMRLQRMLLGRGTLDGVRIVGEATVDAAFANQIGELTVPETVRSADPALSHDVRLGRRPAFGFGLLLGTERRPGMRAPGSGGWLGLGNTCFWVDPASRLTVGLYSASLPFGPPEVRELWSAVEQEIYAGGDDR